ncbi:MAG: glycosyltransferase [Thermogemmatispora sp.]|uniref:glycosyltransferase n=1 Tax=Thermogemmatispora sp. TaxID=1968838 RepID=UPI002635E9B5|nr:glycosyltransferase [Thermogemmatispora sp.]MBX5455399.1 glycosyltransferase [Thermogemmatispora sp.]
MKLLAVIPYIPAPTWGGGARSFYVLKALANKYSVSLIALSRGEKSQETVCCGPLLEQLQSVDLVASPASRWRRWRQALNVVRGESSAIADRCPPGLQAALDRALATDAYQAVYVDGALTAAGLRLPASLPLLILQHNLEYELLYRTYLAERSWLRRWYNGREYRLVKPRELACCQQAAAVLVASERERQLLQELLPQARVGVVPNGVDLSFFAPASTDEEEGQRIVFTGSLDYYPNEQAVLCFARQCWPLIRERMPAAEWWIVGRNPPRSVQRLARLPGVTVTGTVPDVRPYLARASVVVVPLRIGSGTRLKILEALAMKKAVVSTTLGAEGLAVASGRHLLLADTPGDFVRAVILLLEDARRRQALAESGRRLVEQVYSWERCQERLTTLLAEEELLGRRPLLRDSLL